jgi:pilus assembly protein FimV
MRSPPLSLITLAALVALGPAVGAGLGTAPGTVALGQTLNMVIPVFLDASESPSAQCVQAEVLLGDVPLSPAQVKANLETHRDGGNVRHQVRVTTTVPVSEPLLTLNISLGCTARMTRQLVAFADPPERGAASAPAMARASMPAEMSVGGGTASLGGQTVAAASKVVAPPPSKPTRRERRMAAKVSSTPVKVSVNVRASGRPVAKLSTSGAAEKAPAILARKPSNDTVLVSRPRLSPDIIEASLDLSPRLRLDTYERGAISPSVVARNERSLANVEASAAAALAASDAVSALQGQRVEVLERDLQKARSDAAAAKNAAAALKAKMDQPEPSDLLTPVLGGLLALAAAFAGWLAWKLRRVERERKLAWWNAQQAEGQAVAGEPDYSLRTPVAAADDHPEDDGADTSRVAAPAPTPWVESQASSVENLSADVAADPGLADSDALASGSRLSIESLIDLEQQVEFFVVLGQDDSAVELLSDFLQSHSADAPLVHQRLLETYHRKGDVSGFERAAARMRKRFGGDAPAWPTQWDAGRDLAAYPDEMARVQAIQQTPDLAMAALEDLMFSAPGQPVLDLAAYRQALDIYADLRDRRDHPAPAVTPALTLPQALSAAVAVEPEGLPPPMPLPAQAALAMHAPEPASAQSLDSSLEWISSELGSISGRPLNEPPPKPEAPPAWQDSTAAAAHAASLFEAEPLELPRIDMGNPPAQPKAGAKNELMIDLDLSEAKPVKAVGKPFELKLTDA